MVRTPQVLDIHSFDSVRFKRHMRLLLIPCMKSDDVDVNYCNWFDLTQPEVDL